MWGKTSWKEKLLCVPVVIAIFMVDTDDMFGVWIGGACIVALLSVFFKLGVDDEN